MRSVFVLVPSLHASGPEKGAYALAKALAKEREVTLVTLKGAPGMSPALGDGVTHWSLGEVSGGWRERVRAYRSRLESAGGRERVASISLCFSADMVNRFCSRQAVICASVRGNLVQNYRMDYGLLGLPLAVAHLAALARFDYVVAMTEAMGAQVRRYARKVPAVIGNFVDEAELEPYRVPESSARSFRFVFIGSLTSRKQPLLLLRAAQRLLRGGVELHLDVVGGGPLRERIANEVGRLSLRDIVTLHGHLADPYSILSRADAMVLPSLSEGLSRSSLEALYLGVPCVLRDVDGNRELVRSGYNGYLFQDDEALAEAMLSAAALARRAGKKDCLLPNGFRQRKAARQYLQLVEAN